MTKIHALPEGLTKHMGRSARRMSQYHAPGREFIANAADAGATDFRIDGFRLPGGRTVMRLTDNGHGMSATNLRHYMLTLFESGDGRPDNHGMGARFASLPFNPLGVAWVSRTVTGGDAMLVMHKDDEGSYASYEEEVDGIGLTDVFDPESFYPGVLDVLDEWGSESGTAVLLLGDDEVEDTWGTDHYREWGNYAARRWWSWPGELAMLDGNRIYSPNSPTYGNSTWPLSHLLTGMATDQGCVELAGGISVHWYILSDEQTTHGSNVNVRRMQSSIPWSLAPSGRCVVHKGEVWDFRGHNHGGADALNTFGIWHGNIAGRVHLAVHVPDEAFIVDEERLALTTTGGGHMPWSRWGDEFARNMPPELEALLDGVRPESSSSLNEELLATLDDEWARWAGETSALRKAQRGTQRGTPTPRPGGGTGGGTGGGPGPGTPGPTPAPTDGRLTPDTAGSEGGEVIQACDIPNVTWLDDGAEAAVSDGITRKGPSVFSWLAGSSELFIRRSHPAVVQSKERFATAAARVRRPLVDQAVEMAYGTELAARVVHMRIIARKGAVGWSIGDVDAHLADQMTLDGMLLGLNAIDKLVRVALRP